MITKIKRDTKRMVCLLGMSALFAVNMQAKAAEISEPALEIGPILQSENAAILQPSFSISSSGTANVEVMALAKGATSKIDVELNFQKYTSSPKKWKTVKTWKKTKNASNLLFADSYKLSAKGTYRCKCTAVFTKSGKKETITKTTGKKQYK